MLQKKPLFIVFIWVFATAVFAEVTVPKLISDGMILQRNTPVAIWGWADPSEQITVSFKDSLYVTTVDSSGNWKTIISPQKAGGPYTMAIEGTNTIIINDIFIGEVWVCSGQSNMEFKLDRIKSKYSEEIKNANYPLIRQFDVPNAYTFDGPQKNLSGGKWIAANPESVLDFSAVAYFFGKRLHELYDVPIGLINASLGGSPAESWMSEDALKEFPKYFEELQILKDDALVQKITTEDQERKNAWYAQVNAYDRGTKSDPWHARDFKPRGWSVMKIPGYWTNEKLGAVNGSVWFRRDDIEFIYEVKDQPAKLVLGNVVDSDSVWVNGVFIGSTGNKYLGREYEIDTGILHIGKNSITIRVINERGDGGFWEDKPYELIVGDKTVDLQGYWYYEMGAGLEPLESPTRLSWKPAGLYNGMLAPLQKYAIKGVTWYQGESNVNQPEEYDQLFPALITDWRQKWENDSLPFLFVQLANYMKPTITHGPSNWARLREAQLKALSVPYSGMAITIDIGEWNDIHPSNKKDVGERLAKAAQVIAYSENIPYQGPIYKSMDRHAEKNKIVVSFYLRGSPLVIKGDEVLKGFTISDKNKHFVDALAIIEGDKIIVWSDLVKHPLAARYAWADNPEGANLYNEEGLPASPFRTDNWDK